MHNKKNDTKKHKREEIKIQLKKEGGGFNGTGETGTNFGTKSGR